MFKNPFSFQGRIRRLEYGISLIVASAAFTAVNAASEAGGRDAALFTLAFTSLTWWFLLAQGAKRCHDLGHSGWWQIVPLYGLLMAFEDGRPGPNKHGDNPRGIQAIPIVSEAPNQPS
jgi:uncharacterized membrane protein YhaH (DUF805 family)